MKKLFLAIIVFLFVFQIINCQTTITLQPGAEAGKDAILHGHPDYVNTNIGSATQFPASAWSAGADFISRSIVEFDLTSIPEGATIKSAYLTLYAIDPTTATSGMGQHEGSGNSCYLRRITSAWDENTVTWNTQPTTTDVNQVSIPATTSDNQNLENIDVKNLVQDMIDNRSKSFGFMLLLQNEVQYNRVNYSSSDHADANRHPKLVITYTKNSGSLIVQPGAEGKDAAISSHPDNANLNFGTGVQFCASAFSAGGYNFITRGLIDFDLSPIPSNATIDSAFIWLYVIDFSTGGMGYHFGTNQGGSETSCYFQRIISSWDENTVTWNNQPATTEVNQIPVPATISEYDNLVKFNIKNLVQDLVSYRSTSYGMMFRLQTEEKYRRVNYCTSDHTNAAFHPKLAVYYSLLSSDTKMTDATPIRIYPDPSDGKFQVESSNSKTFVISVYSISGKLLKSMNVSSNRANMDLTHYSKGIYILKIESDQQVTTKKILLR